MPQAQQGANTQGGAAQGEGQHRTFRRSMDGRGVEENGTGERSMAGHRADGHSGDAGDQKFATRIHFDNDYHRTAHPKVLEAIAAATGSYPGYGLDDLSALAAERIRVTCAAPEADVHFMVGGTQANATVIAALLRPWEGIVSADTGHINVHETGAVEHSGHKVLALPSQLGKISAVQVADYVEQYRTSGILEHAVSPAMVYISQPTEYGTVYSPDELAQLRQVCDDYGLLLFADGARAGYASHEASLAQLVQATDVCTLGGTKCGALFGEAVVLQPGLAPQFRHAMKQHGGLLAKGWLLGAQFAALFDIADDAPLTVYEGITQRASQQAQRIAQALRDNGIETLFDSPTNQQFALLSPVQEQRLNRSFISQYFGEHEGRRVVRLCTSWATQEEEVDALIALLPDIAAAS